MPQQEFTGNSVEPKPDMASTDQANPEHIQTSQQSRRWRLALVLSLFFCFLFYLPGLSRPVGLFHDDAIYILTGRALKQGQGYRITSIPGMPRQTKYPPLYPAVLSLLWRIQPAFPANTVLFRLVNILFWLVALALTFDLLVRFRYTSPGIALLIVVWRGFSPDAVHFTSLVLTEPLVTLLVTGSLWFCEASLAAELRRQRIGYAAFSGFTLGLAILTRSSVLFLSIALAWALLRKCRLGALAMALSALPAYIGWILWARRPSRLPGWDPRCYYLDYIGWVLNQYSLTPLPLVFIANLLHLFTFALPAQALPFDPHGIIAGSLPHGFNWFVAMIGAGVSILIMRGGILLWRQGRPLLPLAALTLTIPVCGWPADIGRYVLPSGMICLLLALLGWHQLQLYLQSSHSILLVGARSPRLDDVGARSPRPLASKEEVHATDLGSALTPLSLASLRAVQGEGLGGEGKHPRFWPTKALTTLTTALALLSISITCAVYKSELLTHKRSGW